MESQTTGTNAATGQNSELMECIYSGDDNSMVVNIDIGIQNQAALQQSLETTPCIIKQEGNSAPQQASADPSGEVTSVLQQLETGCGDVQLITTQMDTTDAAQPHTEQGAGESQGGLVCIVKEEQEISKELLRDALTSADITEAAAGCVKVEDGGDHDSELVNVTIQTNEGESLNIKLPRRTLKGSGLGDMLPVVDSVTGDGTYQFECFLCGALFRKAAYLKAHMPVHTGDKPFKCSECSAAFATQSQLTIHTRVHTGNKPFLSVEEYKQEADGQENIQAPKPKNRYPCNQCPASFKVPSHLERHVRHKHTGEKPYKCPDCSATFAKPSDLKRHMKRHTGESRYACTECPAAFKTSSALRWHSRGHFGQVKAHQCTHCPAAFRAQNDLNTHMRIHTGEKPYKCSHCPGAFAQSSTLRKHMRIHDRKSASKSSEGLAPHLIPPFLQKKKRTGQGHVCSECSARFIRPSDLVRHMRKHTGERPFACSQCSKAFTRQSDLKMHLKIHTGEKSFQCSVCPSSFRSRGDLNKHMRLHTGEKPYMCAECGQMFRLLGNLKAHMKSHPMPEEVKAEASEPKPQIYTVQIIEAPATGDHSYMCPGAVFPATQHIIIQASEAQGYGGFGLQSVTIPQPKQVAEVGTQVTPMPEDYNEEKVVLGQGTFQSNSNTLATEVETEDSGTSMEETPFVPPPPAEPEEETNTQEMDAEAKEAELSFNINLAYLHKCSVCKASFKKKLHLNRHMLIHSGEKPHKCGECDSAFFTKAQLTVHKRVHTGNSSVAGTDPSQSTDTDVKLESGDGSNSKKRYKCWECSAEFSIPSHLTRHAKNKHSVDRPYQCPDCPAAFRRPSDLKRHIRNHTGQNPYLCPQCPAAFTAMSSLKVHAKKAHKVDGKVFPCSMCPDSFGTQTELTAHYRGHTGEKPFKCSECPAEFAQSSNLNKHVVIHYRERENAPSSEDTADQSSKSPESFLLSMGSFSMTPGAKPFMCTECGATFTRSSDLKIHYRKHTGERPYLCSECPSTFARLTDLKMHNKIHTGERGFPCSECSAAFRSKGDLNKHNRIHTGEKPYMCAECGATFRQSGSLKAHLKAHVGQEHKLKRPESKLELKPL